MIDCVVLHTGPVYPQPYPTLPCWPYLQWSLFGTFTQPPVTPRDLNKEVQNGSA